MYVLFHFKWSSLRVESSGFWHQLLPGFSPQWQVPLSLRLTMCLTCVASGTSLGKRDLCGLETWALLLWATVLSQTVEWLCPALFRDALRGALSRHAWCLHAGTWGVIVFQLLRALVSETCCRVGSGQTPVLLHSSRGTSCLSSLIATRLFTSQNVWAWSYIKVTLM